MKLPFPVCLLLPNNHVIYVDKFKILRELSDVSRSLVIQTLIYDMISVELLRQLHAPLGFLENVSVLPLLQLAYYHLGHRQVYKALVQELFHSRLVVGMHRC